MMNGSFFSAHLGTFNLDVFVGNMVQTTKRLYLFWGWLFVNLYKYTHYTQAIYVAHVRYHMFYVIFDNKNVEKKTCFRGCDMALICVRNRLLRVICSWCNAALIFYSTWIHFSLKSQIMGGKWCLQFFCESDNQLEGWNGIMTSLTWTWIFDFSFNSNLTWTCNSSAWIWHTLEYSFSSSAQIWPELKKYRSSNSGHPNRTWPTWKLGVQTNLLDNTVVSFFVFVV